MLRQLRKSARTTRHLSNCVARTERALRSVGSGNKSIMTSHRFQMRQSTICLTLISTRCRVSTWRVFFSQTDYFQMRPRSFWMILRDYSPFNGSTGTITQGLALVYSTQSMTWSSRFKCDWDSSRLARTSLNISGRLRIGTVLTPSGSMNSVCLIIHPSKSTRRKSSRQTQKRSSLVQSRIRRRIAHLEISR